MAFVYNSGGFVTGTSSANPIQFNYTAGSNSRLVVLAINHLDNASAAITGTPTYDGQNMSQAGSFQSSAEGGNEIWYYLSPVASSKQISIPNGNAELLRYNVSDYTNATAAAAIFGSAGTTDGSAADVVETINSVPDGSVCVSCMVHGEKDQFASVSVLTSFHATPSIDEGAKQSGAGYSIQSGTANETHTYTSGGTADDYSDCMAAWEESIINPDINVADENPNVQDYAKVVTHLAINVNDTVTITESETIETSFVFTIDTTNTSVGSSNSDQFDLPLYNGGTYDFTIQWGDGNSDEITAYDDADKLHTYSAGGTYTIQIFGTCTGFQFNNTGDRLKILDIKAWSSFKLGNVSGYFYGCANLTVSATDVLDMTGTTLFTDAFRGCSALTDLPSGNSWNVSSVTSMNRMFQDTAFNGNITGWTTSALTDVRGMFEGSPFNQDISGWDMADVTDFTDMFWANTAFNQDIGGWTVSSATTMRGMFYGATSFNQNLNSWNVSGVANMGQMFQGSGFNGNITGWTTTALTDMNQMFRNCPFNQDISGWDVDLVTNMSGCFRDNTVFNQAIGSWTTSALQNVSIMFWGATAFDQNLSNWDFADVTNLTSFFGSGSGLSTVNYDALLISLDGQSLQPNETADFGDSYYNSAAAATARANIISGDGWTINDLGQWGAPNVYDSITITDYTDVSVTAAATLSINVNDNITVQEDSQQYLTLYEITVDDDIGLQDSSVLELNLYFIAVDDDIGLEDASSQYLTVYLISVDDDIITEDSSEQYLTIYVVNVSNDIGLQDESQQYLTLYEINVFDSLNLEDSTSLELSYYEINVFDSIAVIEYIDVLVTAADQLNINVYDDVGLQDSATLEFDLYLVEVSDNITTEDISNQYLTLYEIVVSDDVGVEDYTDISLVGVSVCSINVYDDVGLQDSTSNYLTLYEIISSDDLIVEDSTTNRFDLYLISESDDITILDSIDARLNPYLISEYESIDVTEYTNQIVALKSRLVNVNETVGVADYTDVALAVYPFLQIFLTLRDTQSILNVEKEMSEFKLYE